jgi:hypothetical protein
MESIAADMHGSDQTFAGDDIDAQRRARRERALRAQRELEAVEAAKESSSEYETVCYPVPIYTGKHMNLYSCSQSSGFIKLLCLASGIFTTTVSVVYPASLPQEEAMPSSRFRGTC